MTNRTNKNKRTRQGGNSSAHSTRLDKSCIMTTAANGTQKQEGLEVGVQLWKMVLKTTPQIENSDKLFNFFFWCLYIKSRTLKYKPFERVFNSIFEFPELFTCTTYVVKSQPNSMLQCPINNNIRFIRSEYSTTTCHPHATDAKIHTKKVYCTSISFIARKLRNASASCNVLGSHSNDIECTQTYSVYSLPLKKIIISTKL